MDPLTALSLAGNIIQFVDFGTKLLSQGYELYKSTGGKLEVDEEVELITSDLSGLINKIQYAIKVQKAPSATTQTLTHSSNAHQPVFDKICDEATRIAQIILAKLETLKIDNTKNRKLETFKRIWKRLWSQKEIDELVNSLSRLKDVINTEALAAILQNTNELNVRTLAHFDSLDQQTQLILRSLVESNQVTTQTIMAAIAQLMGRLEAFDLEDQNRQTRGEIIDKRANDENLKPIESITATVEILAVSQREEKALRADVQQVILENLAYVAMPQRYEQVVDAHPTTFDWALTDSSDGSTNLANWLKTGNGLYWISGKPGSGKSTLMKHIYDDDRTRSFLSKWASEGEAQPVPLLIGTFFFWASGTLEQRSHIGMLRSVLFQILEQKPELLSVVFPSLWAKQYEKRISEEPSVWSEPWTLRILMEAFRRLISQRVIPAKIFFLIDGLDEFEGDHEVLAELFNDIAQASDHGHNHFIKCCVSSRPWVVFKENFEGSPMLQLQDLTFNDIETFVKDKTLANSAFKRLAELEPQATSELIHEIVSKAEGVFLWVHVVVIDLLRGIRKRDSMPDLWKRLEALPSDLEDLYRQIMSQIEPAHLVWASKSFQIVRSTRELEIPKKWMLGLDHVRYVSKYVPGFVSLGELYFALDETLTEKGVEKLSQEALDEKCKDTDYHVTARCACLLEVIRPSSQKEVKSNDKVQFLHRTARDFIEREDRWNKILDRTRAIQFNPYYCMMRCSNLMLFQLANQKGNRKAQLSRLHNILIALLSFASKADSHTPSRLQRNKILDYANKLIVDRDINMMGGSIELSALKISKTLKPIMPCALGLNISQYIATELHQISSINPQEAKSIATRMLRNRISVDNHNRLGLPYISVDMASVLIEFGADLNYKKGSSSTWEKFLYQAKSTLSHANKSYNPDFAKLMSLFLSAGADPDVLLVTFKRVIATYVSPNYFSSTDDLYNEIVEALKLVEK